ncbi:MAG: tetratricopeptide repeat protein [Woeseiaceae bacterium]
MDVYSTEEEQVQAIKKWWKDNAVSIISGIVIGAAVLGGYKFWNEHKLNQAQEASMLYSEVLILTSDKSVKIEILKNDYASTPYAALSALLEAKNLVVVNKLDEAVAQLKWVVDNNHSEGIQHIAQQRLARVYLSQNKITEAESLIKGIKADGFNPIYSEIRGDINLAKKLTVQAKENYRIALAALSRSDKRFTIIKMKLDDLTQISKAK